MTGKRKQRTLIAVAVAVVAVGVVVAILTAPHHGQGRSGGRDGRRDGGRTAAEGSLHTVDVAASYLHITRAQLRKELRSGRTLAEIADATSGKSASGLISRLANARAERFHGNPASSEKAKVSAREAAFRRAATARVQRAHTAGASAPTIALAAQYLGVPPAEVLGELQHGHSLAQIADAHKGHSSVGLIAALVRARRISIAAQVRSGKLDRQRAQKRLSGLERHVGAHVSHAPAAAASDGQHS
jgi:hypothetical protein